MTGTTDVDIETAQDALKSTLFIATVVLVIYDLWQARHQARIMAPYWRQLLIWLVLIGAAITLAALTLDGPKPPDMALAGTVWIVAWIVYVTVVLVRSVPVRDGVMPEFLLRGPGLADAVLITFIVGGAGYYYGCGLFYFCS